MKKIYKVNLTIIFFAFVSFFVFTKHVNAENREIVFKDTNLYNAMKDILKSDIISNDENNQTICIAEETINKITNVKINNKNITDLSGIENFNRLSSLDVEDNHIKSIKPLQSMSLNVLKVSYLEEIDDYNLLEKYNSLNSLYISESSLSEIPNEIKNISTVTEFSWNDGLLEDTAWITCFPKLKELKLNNNKIKSLSNLSKLQELTSLELKYNQLDNIDEIGKISGLYHLDISNNNVTCIDGLSNLKFKTFRASNNRINSIKSLNIDTSALLYDVDVSNNCIYDLSTIKDKFDTTHYKISGQVLTYKVQAGKAIELPDIIKQKNGILGTENIETINCRIDSEKNKCIIDENVSYARIKINDGSLMNTIIYYDVENTQVPGITADSINLTKEHIIILLLILAFMISFVIVTSMIKRRKQNIKEAHTNECEKK